MPCILHSSLILFFFCLCVESVRNAEADTYSPITSERQKRQETCKNRRKADNPTRMQKKETPTKQQSREWRVGETSQWTLNKPITSR